MGCWAIVVSCWVFHVERFWDCWVFWWVTCGDVGIVDCFFLVLLVVVRIVMSLFSCFGVG